MNIFEIPRNEWWKYINTVIENVNLSEILIHRNNCFKFTFLNSHSRPTLHSTLMCNNIMIFSLNNDALENEDFAYFVLDVYIKELSKEELYSAINYYKYGYNINFDELKNLYLLVIIGTEFCMDIICEAVEICNA